MAKARRGREVAAKRQVLQELRRHLAPESDRERFGRARRAGSQALGRMDAATTYLQLRDELAHDHRLDVLSDLAESMEDFSHATKVWEVSHADVGALVDKLSPSDWDRIHDRIGQAFAAVEQATARSEKILSELGETTPPGTQQLSLLGTLEQDASLDG